MALKLLSIKNITFIPQRFYNSALFISGNKAKDSFSPLVPKLDIDAIFLNTSQIKNELIMRNMNLDIEAIKEKWNIFKKFDKDKQLLEENRMLISKEINNIKSQKLNNHEELLSPLYLKSQLIKDDLQSIIQPYYDLEESVMIDILRIPNKLDADTTNEEKIYYQSKNLRKIPISISNHLELGKAQNLIEYYNPSRFYLHDNGALLERTLSKYFCKQFLSSEWIRFSNTDFSTSLIVEGSDMEHSNPEIALVLEQKEKKKGNLYDTLHLTGGASLYSFCSYFAKTCIDSINLPIRCFTSGSQYNPVIKDNLGLFNVLQQPAIHAFIGTHENGKEEFLSSLQLLIKLYESLNLHFRVVFVPASLLKPSESLRANFQMYSPGNSSYINVGYLSLYNDFISRRLLMCNGNIKTNYKFMNVVSGTVAYILKIIACVLETEKEINTFNNLVKSLK